MKLTPAQVAMMRNELAGRNICAGLSGRSAHGGATWTMQALLRKGLLRRAGGLTPTGEAALRAHDSKVPNVELTGLRRPYGEGPVERHVGRQNGGTE